MSLPTLPTAHMSTVDALSDRNDALSGRLISRFMRRVDYYASEAIRVHTGKTSFLVQQIGKLNLKITTPPK